MAGGRRRPEKVVDARHPGDVVVEIGTGTGVLAVAAVQAGARHVYAIEASGIGKFSKAIFQANGVADQITLIQGWSTQISLPERADGLVCELVGNEPLQERILEVTTDARKRFLKEDAWLVPARLKIFALPVAIPDAELMKYTFTAATLQKWRSWYDIDFGPLGEAARNSPHFLLIDPFKARDWKTLSEPVLLADVNFKTVRNLAIDTTQLVSANASGLLNGLIVYFERKLGPRTHLSTHPRQVEETNHWRSPLWVFSDPLLLEPGSRFKIGYRYRVAGARDGVYLSSA